MQTNRVRPVRRLAVAMTLVVGLAAAALGAASVASAASAEPTGQPRPTMTDRVVVERTGGIAGVHDTFIVESRNTSPEAEKLFALTSSPEFLALDPVYLPQDTCCDFFEYRVTVSYTDGSGRWLVTMDGGDAPDLVWDVIGLTQSIGQRG
jgi:hypothetical protein